MVIVMVDRSLDIARTAAIIVSVCKSAFSAGRVRFRNLNSRRERESRDLLWWALIPVTSPVKVFAWSCPTWTPVGSE